MLKTEKLNVEKRTHLTDGTKSAAGFHLIGWGSLSISAHEEIIQKDSIMVRVESYSIFNRVLKKHEKHVFSRISLVLGKY